MTKTTEYELTCSYDLNQTGKVKYDSYIVRAFEKIGGTLTNRFEDDYGGRDLSITVKSDLNTLQKTVKDILGELKRKDAKINITAKKVQYCVSVEGAEFKDLDSFQALAAGWASEKSINYENQGNAFKLMFNSKSELETFKNSLLPQANIFTTNNQTPSYFIDEVNEPVISADNYNAKNKSSLTV